MSDNSEVDDDDGTKATRDKYSGFTPTAVSNPVQHPELMPLVQVEPLPPVADMVCLQGPCRHYWHLVTLGPDGKASGLRQHHHTCLVQPGRETDLGDDFVFECSRWDPMSPFEHEEREHRRNKYKGDE